MPEGLLDDPATFGLGEGSLTRAEGPTTVWLSGRPRGDAHLGCPLSGLAPGYRWEKWAADGALLRSRALQQASAGIF